MRLLRYQVTNFRSVADSGWIEADEVTALIGVNESGKTNLLLPLWKLNPAREGELQPTSDYPKKLFGLIRETPGDYQFVNAEFDTGDLAATLANLAGVSAKVLARVQVARFFDKSYKVLFPDASPLRSVEQREVIEALKTASREITALQALKAEETIKATMLSDIDVCLEKLESELDANALEALRTRLAQAQPAESPKTSVIAPRYAQILEHLDSLQRQVSQKAPGDIDAVRDAVVNSLPKFVYYSNYGNLDSEIYLPHVVQNLKRTDLGSKEAAKARTLRVLFKFVRLSPEEVLDLGRDLALTPGTRPSDQQVEAISEKKRERSILLQSASVLLTRRFREWWKQGDYRFRFEADGDHFRIWVADERRPEEIELENRSTGLQWFLSFYLVFLVESEDAHRDSVLLLDEPGLSLHPLAQRDLSAFFDGLAETNQIIYTTHSPFLVDADRLDRARKVYVGPDGATRSSSNLREGGGDEAQKGAAYAVHSALNLTTSESLLLGCRPVIVEGASDQHYLAAIKTLLIRSGKITPSRELVFPPSGGAKTARLIASILTGRDDSLPHVLLDDDAIGRKVAKEMVGLLYAQAPERVLNVGSYVGFEFAEVEDLMPTAILAAQIDRHFRVPEPEDEFSSMVKSGHPVVPQIEAWAAAHKIELPQGWKVRLATTVKQQLLARGLDVVDPALRQVWANLFVAFET